MNPAARLQATLDLLTEVENTARPADAVSSAFFRARRYIDDNDRASILDLLYALLRHRARLGWWLARQASSDTPRNRLLAWLMLAEGKTPQQVKRLFNGAKFAPAALTDREYALAGKLLGGTIVHPDMSDEVRLECPPWAAEALRRRFGKAFEAEMAATLLPPPLDLRVNPIKSTRAAVLQELKSLGLEAEATSLAPQGIRVGERFSLARLKGLKTGEVEIQDEGSQLVAQLIDARPGDRVADFCAGAGGKTLALSAQMAGKGHIVACDVNEARLKRCAERLRRAGLHNAETRLLTSETDKWIKRRKGSFDRVLVDAPCSGTGTWRRNPDARWRAPEEKGLEHLVSLQARILASAARLVKPGGRLVYATCSMLPEENEDQVTTFLAANPAFRLIPLRETAPQLAEVNTGDTLSLTPARHGTDGFFAAILQREA
ncbi:MAG: RsmB/NOP family class I SAM-dependent RNA methyltransferase [Roseivivax sp.]|nr:RsmB/NOP family class I SAM-dependent RNA methyltransferase [Roseivivax sp.]